MLRPVQRICGVVVLCACVNAVGNAGVAFAQDEAALAPANATDTRPDAPSTTTPAASDATAPRFDLARLTSAAAGTYPGVRAAEHRVAVASTFLEEARWSPYFQVQLQGFATAAPQARGNPVFSPDSQLPLSNPWSPVGGLTLSALVPLYTWGKLDGLRDAAAAGIDAAQHDETRVSLQLRTDLRRAYFGLQLALDAREMLSEANDAVDRAERSLEERLEAGEAGADETERYQLLAVQAELAGRSSEAVRGEMSARAAVTALTGVERFEPPACPLAAVEITLDPAEQYVARAREHRPELLMGRAGLRARRAAVGIAEGMFGPDFGLSLQTGFTTGPGVTDQTNPFVFDPANSPTLFAGLVARWNLDLPGNVIRLQRANAELAETRERIDEGLRGLDLEVRTTYEAARDAERRVAAWERGERGTRSWLVASVQAYQIGTLEARELVDSVRAYFTARFNAMQARHDFNVSLAALERAVGTPIVPAGSWERGCEDVAEPAPTE